MGLLALHIFNFPAIFNHMEPHLRGIGASLLPAQRTEVLCLPSHKIGSSVHSENMHHPIKLTKHQQAQHLPGRRITRFKIRPQAGAAPCFLPLSTQKVFHSLEQTREGLSLFHWCKETPLTNQTSVWPRNCSTIWFLTPHTHSPPQ